MIYIYYLKKIINIFYAIISKLFLIIEIKKIKILFKNIIYNFFLKNFAMILKYIINLKIFRKI